MKPLRLILLGYALLAVILCGVFVFMLASYPRYSSSRSSSYSSYSSSYKSIDGENSFKQWEKTRDKYHLVIKLASIPFFIAGAGVFFAVGWYPSRRKWLKIVPWLAVIGCFAMMLWSFLLSGAISFNEVGIAWIVAAIVLAGVAVASAFSLERVTLPPPPPSSLPLPPPLPAEIASASNQAAFSFQKRGKALQASLVAFYVALFGIGATLMILAGYAGETFKKSHEARRSATEARSCLSDADFVTDLEEKDALLQRYETCKKEAAANVGLAVQAYESHKWYGFFAWSVIILGIAIATVAHGFGHKLFARYGIGRPLLFTAICFWALAVVMVVCIYMSYAEIPHFTENREQVSSFASTYSSASLGEIENTVHLLYFSEHLSYQRNLFYQAIAMTIGAVIVAVLVHFARWWGAVPATPKSVDRVT